MHELDLLQPMTQKLHDAHIMDECLSAGRDEKSYYSENTGTYLEQLQINTPVLFEKKLREMWSDADENEEVQRLIKLVTVLAFKMKEEEWVSDVVKERIYNF